MSSYSESSAYRFQRHYSSSLTKEELSSSVLVMYSPRNALSIFQFNSGCFFINKMFFSSCFLGQRDFIDSTENALVSRFFFFYVILIYLKFIKMSIAMVDNLNKFIGWSRVHHVNIVLVDSLVIVMES